MFFYNEWQYPNPTIVDQRHKDERHYIIATSSRSDRKAFISNSVRIARMCAPPIRDTVGYTPLYQEFLDFGITSFRGSVPQDLACSICKENTPDSEGDLAKKTWWGHRHSSIKKSNTLLESACLTKEDAKVQIVDCEHVFHKTCFLVWIKEYDVCPVCRRKQYRSD